MFLFLGVWRLHSLAKATGAVAFALSSFMITQTDYYATAIGWVPLILFFYHRALVHLRFSTAVLAGISIALAFCQGDLQTIYGTVFLILIYTVVLRKGVRGNISPGKYYRFVWKSYLLMGAVALLISAVQLLPSIQTLICSGKLYSTTIKEASQESLHLGRLQEFVHYAHHSDLHDEKMLKFMGINEPSVRRIFLGLASVFLLGFALHRLSKRALLIACGLVVTFVLSLGSAGGIFSLLWHALPGFKILKSPEKWLGLFTFFFTAGLALGLDRFQRKEAKNYHRWSGWTPLPIIIVMIFLILWLGSPAPPLPAMPDKGAALRSVQVNGWIYAAGITIIFISLAALAVLRVIRVRRFVPIFGAICILELLAFQSWAKQPDLESKHIYENIRPVGIETITSNPSARLIRFPADSYIANETYEKKRKRAEFRKNRIRAEMWRRTYHGNIGSEYQAYTVHGHTSNERPEEKIFWHTANYIRAINCFSAKYLLAHKGEPVIRRNPHLKAISSFDNELVIFENSQALPRAYCVSRSILKSEDGEAAITLFEKEFDPRKEVVLSCDEASLEISDDAPPPDAELIKHEPRRIEVRILNSEKPAFLILTDSYEYGWKAKVDEKVLPIYRANLLFRAVLIPAGAKKVEFYYNPWTFYLGLMISILSGLLVVPLYLLFRRKDIEKSNNRHNN
ncbi:MAG: YfhO family protein [Planctomycetota bacterium]